MSSQPSAKQIVDVLMEKIGEENRDVPSRNDPEIRIRKTYNIFKCPKGEFCSSGGQFKFPKGSGYTNPLNHLRSCLANGNHTNLMEIYEQKKKEKLRNSSFVSVKVYNEWEKAMFAFLNLSVAHSLPI